MNFDEFRALTPGCPFEYDGKTVYVSHCSYDVGFSFAEDRWFEIATIIVEPTHDLAMRGPWSTPLGYPGTDRIFYQVRTRPWEDKPCV